MCALVEVVQRRAVEECVRETGLAADDASRAARMARLTALCTRFPHPGLPLQLLAMVGLVSLVSPELLPVRHVVMASLLTCHLHCAAQLRSDDHRRAVLGSQAVVESLALPTFWHVPAALLDAGAKVDIQSRLPFAVHTGSGGLPLDLAAPDEGLESLVALADDYKRIAALVLDPATTIDTLKTWATGATCRHCFHWQ